MKVISCLIDCTETSKIAVSYAADLARKEEATLNLLHITHEGSFDEVDLESRIRAFAGTEVAQIQRNVSLGDGHYLE